MVTRSRLASIDRADVDRPETLAARPTHLDCLRGVRGEPWLISPRLRAVLPFTRHVSSRFRGGSASSRHANPLMPTLNTSSSSSHAGLLRFLSSSRKYITFSVLWLGWQKQTVRVREAIKETCRGSGPGQGPRLIATRTSSCGKAPRSRLRDRIPGFRLAPRISELGRRVTR